MVVLLAVNVLGAVLFAGLYALAGSARVPQHVFWALLPILFVGTTALWVRAEGRAGQGGPARRLARAALGLVLAVTGLPILVLSPLFWLERQLPAEAVHELHIAPIMALLFVALVLVVLVNVVGAAVAITLRRRPSAGAGTR